MSLAKILEYGVSTTRAGDPKISIQFEVEGETKPLYWTGTMKEGKAKEIAIKTLVEVCEFQGDSLEQLNQGIAGGALNHLKEYDVAVEEQTMPDGKVVRRIAWINLPGSGKFKRADETELGILLKGYDFKNDFKAARAVAPKTEKKAEPKVEEDIGF